VFGGANVGIMGKISRCVLHSNSKVIGVIPENMIKAGIKSDSCSEAIITKTMRERKQKMEYLSDVFCILPGGFGTFEEMFEIITLKQLGNHTKPVVIFNINHFFDELIKIFDKFYDERFAKRMFESLYYITDKIEDGIGYIKDYNQKSFPNKWY